jgi:flagellar biosynthesis protein FlhF
MKIKTYQAATMQDALQAIKAEMGEDAVILATKQHPKGQSHLGHRMVEVTAAIDIEAPRVCVPSRGRVVPPPKAIVPDQPKSTATFGDVLRASLSGVGQAIPRETRQGSGRAGVSLPQDEWHAMQAELKHIRERLGSHETPSLEYRAPEAGPYYDRLVDSGLDVKTAQELLHDVQAQVPSSAPRPVVQDALQRAIAGQVKTSGPLFKKEECKKTVILVGPTGVGKTTTIAKLAAYYRQHERRSVALITLDTYRIAAVDQLRMYADLIGVTMDVALTRGDAVRCMAKRTDAELILVDTAGRSPHDRARMTEVRDLLGLNHPVEVHLVLSATTRERDLMQHTTHYRGIPFTRLLFTKVDETTGGGGVFDLMRKTGVPLSYFGVGQRVPEDLEVARPERLADLLVGASTGTMAASIRAGMTA